MLYNLIISPIEILVEWIFLLITQKMSFLGIAGAIFGVSMAINFLALPLYNIADSIQENERRIAKKLESGVKRIKSVFKGDEQFMMLQAFYRENNYHPLYALRSSLSILIEIPFFIAAYHFLSHAEALKGVSFLFLNDLGAPDRISSVTIAGLTLYINILPILMTLINLVSGAVYSKDASWRERAQIFVLAFIFLVLLYDSPSGLVFYWILNNLFSLGKNIVLKTKHPKKIAHIVITILLAAFTSMFLLRHPESSTGKKAALIFATAIVAFIPAIYRAVKKSIKFSSLEEPELPLFVSSAICLSLLAGIVLPANVIASSPLEFCFIGNTANPLSYIKTTAFIFSGLFILWPSAIYKMFGKKTKAVLPFLFFVLALTAISNAFIFKSEYGTINSAFVLERRKGIKELPLAHKILPFVATGIIIAFYAALRRFKKTKILSSIMISLCIGEVIFGAFKISYIKKAYVAEAKIRSELDSAKTANTGTLESTITPVFHLSKTQKNVVVIFLDRCVGALILPIFEQFPQMKSDYSGFTFYPNTLSFSTYTLTGFPGMAGGYEYTLPKINARSDEKLSDKHNETILLMPKLFLDAGFDVTVADLPNPNYGSRKNLSLYKKYPEINAHHIAETCLDYYLQSEGLELDSNNDKITRKQAVPFTVMQMLYPSARLTLYAVTMNDFSDYEFEKEFSTLYALRKLTDFKNQKGSFTFLDTETCHEYRFLKAPEFTQKGTKSNNSTGTYKCANDEEMKAYHVQAASLKQIALWLNQLKENGAYDNTRIIITSDHGYDINPAAFSHISNGSVVSRFNPVLLVKDFESSGELKTDDTFMTNADTLFFAKQELPVSDTNPFTGKKLVQEKDSGIPVYIAVNREWLSSTVEDSTQFTLDKSKGWIVGKNIFDPENWKSLDE